MFSFGILPVRREDGKKLNFETIVKRLPDFPALLRRIRRSGEGELI